MDKNVDEDNEKSFALNINMKVVQFSQIKFSMLSLLRVIDLAANKELPI
jgi:hypothetical protein